MKLALCLFAAGSVGAAVGAWLFAILERLGQLDLVISLSYTIFLGSIGTLMLTEAVGAILRPARRESPAARCRPAGGRATTTGSTSCRSRSGSGSPGSTSASSR